VIACACLCDCKVDNPLEKWAELSLDADNDQVQFISGKHGKPGEEEFQKAMQNLKTVCAFSSSSLILSPAIVIHLSPLFLDGNFLVWICGNL